jgi:hypothetical protein
MISDFLFQQFLTRRILLWKAVMGLLSHAHEIGTVKVLLEIIRDRAKTQFFVVVVTKFTVF